MHAEPGAAPAAPGHGGPVRRRLVMYVSGFDPQGPARYHRLYREQAQAQCRASGHQIEVGARKRVDPLADAWEVESRIEGAPCSTRYMFLRWDDIVRARWNPGHWRYLGMTLGATWRNLRDGALWRLFKATWVGASVCAGPFIVLLFNALAAALLAAGVAVAWARTGPSPWFAAALAIAALGAWGIARLSRHGEERWYMGWTTRSYWFTTHQARGQTPELDERLDRHAERLLQALADPAWDEVLLVGHSSGAMMATIIAGRAARRDAQAMRDARVSLMTLGQCFPILGFQHAARQFRAELRAAADALGPARWLDFTAPTDRCCCALHDPAMAVRGMDGIDCSSPKILSPRFASLFTPATYAQLRRRDRLFDMHFQYIQASELPGTYDYFAITAGPQMLPQRFAAQPGVQGWREFECFGGPFPGLRRATGKEA